jgi:periplasmic protein TonB
MVDHESEEPLRIWVLAAAAAVALHVACLAAAVAYRHEEPEEALGAQAIEIGIEPTAPRIEPSNLPAGPDVEASAASAAVAAQKEVVKPSELPKALPTETDDPERVVTPNDSKRPKKDDPEVTSTQAAPSDASVAAVATATPSPQTAQESTHSVAPAQGTDESAQRVRATWQKELAAHFDKYKRYPADRVRQSAELVVSFDLDRTGHILSARIVQGSGDPSFDEAGLAMMRRADPVPAPPPLVADEGLSFTMPIIFRAKGKS